MGITERVPNNCDMFASEITGLVGVDCGLAEWVVEVQMPVGNLRFLGFRGNVRGVFLVRGPAI